MKKKQEIITFKVDSDLLEAIKGIPNRSEFIREAITSALGVICPLCSGSGMLTQNQKRHWEEFATNHSIRRCNECHESVLVCQMDAK
jgi:metal-responsive CopG/Arc/MetJ family transcriptional regulator